MVVKDNKYDYNGAFTLSLMSAFKKTLSLSIYKIINEAYSILNKNNLSQIPQVTSNRILHKYSQLLYSPYRYRIIRYIQWYNRWIILYTKYYHRFGLERYKRFSDYLIKIRNRLLSTIF